jgi:hypothetical protein
MSLFRSGREAYLPQDRIWELLGQPSPSHRPPRISDDHFSNKRVRFEGGATAAGGPSSFPPIAASVRPPPRVGASSPAGSVQSPADSSRFEALERQCSAMMEEMHRLRSTVEAGHMESDGSSAPMAAFVAVKNAVRELSGRIVDLEERARIDKETIKALIEKVGHESACPFPPRTPFMPCRQDHQTFPDPPDGTLYSWGITRRSMPTCGWGWTSSALPCRWSSTKTTTCCR